MENSGDNLKKRTNNLDVFLTHTRLQNQSATIKVTGSKSESNRLLILQALYPNITIHNVSESDDTRVLYQALKTNKEIIDIHHAGTAMRFLTAYFACKEGANVLLTGSDRMKQRPIKILVDALLALGANIAYVENEGFPPLRIKGTNLSKAEVSIDGGISSQYISALLLVAPSLSRGLKVNLEGTITSLPYLKMTLSLLTTMGISHTFNNNTIEIPPVTSIADNKHTVESDWSSASYFYSLVALSDGLEIQLSSYQKQSLQGDAALATIFEKLGVVTHYSQKDHTILLKKKGSVVTTLELNLINTPDIAQTLAVTCFGLGIGCQLSGLHTLKIKETDRLVALKTELEKLGATVIIDHEKLALLPNSVITSGVTIDTYNDHRMAMAFAPLALKKDIVIKDAQVVSKSFPSFWNDLKTIGVQIDAK